MRALKILTYRVYMSHSLKIVLSFVLFTVALKLYFALEAESVRRMFALEILPSFPSSMARYFINTTGGIDQLINAAIVLLSSIVSLLTAIFTAHTESNSHSDDAYKIALKVAASVCISITPITLSCIIIMYFLMFFGFLYM